MPPSGGEGGGVKRGFIIKKAKQEDCLEKTLKKKHIWRVPSGSLAAFGQPGQLVLHPLPVNPRGGDSAYERGGDARWKCWIKPLKETDLGVAQAFFQPKKKPC